MFRIIPLFIILLLPFESFSQSDASSAKSIVKVKTTYKGKDQSGNPSLVVNTSTGWAWSNPQWIITTLHSVAGVENIEVCSTDGKCTKGKVERVLKEADLALVKIEKDLGLKPLATKSVNPQSAETYYIWGYPHGVYTIQGDEIKFSRSLNQFPTLSDILTGNKLKQQLVNQGYPLPSAKIYRISSIIQPGHSGAPILTTSGEVIGIADGGLRGGTARINWAMPSEVYLRGLLNSNDNIPSSISIQNDLYSHAYYVPLNTDESEVDNYIAHEEEVTTVSSGTGKEVHKTWTASMDEIYWTLEEEDQTSIDEILSDGGAELIGDVYFDIYEDYSTGASFAVPSGSKVTYEDELFHVEMDYSYLAFLPLNTASFDEASETLDLFVEEVLAQYSGSVEAEGIDGNYEMDEYDEYINRVDVREVYYEGQNYLLAVGGEVMGSDLACLLLFCPVPREMDEDQLKEFLKLALATEIISFSGH